MYESFAEMFKDTPFAEVWKSIAKEKKTHVGEFLTIPVCRKVGDKIVCGGVKHARASRVE